MKRHHSYEEKLEVVNEILCGKGIKTLCRERHLDRHMVFSWLGRYRMYGNEGLLKPTDGHRLSSSEKERIVWEHVRKGVSLSELSLRYDVHRSTIKYWLRKVRSGGILSDVNHQIYPLMGRPKKRPPQTELERLQEENLRLRAENALLKKVKALVEEEKARARLNGQEPSTN